MTRRPTTLILSAATIALLAGGCTTFSDNDAIARVDDDELSRAQLDEILPLVTDLDTLAPEATAGATRTAISIWLEAQVFGGAVADAGIEIDDTAVDATVADLSAQFGDAFTGLSDDTRDLLVDYVVGIDRLGELPRPDEDEVAAWFDRGIDVTNLACVSHILVETEEEAEEIVAELAEAQAAGGDFDEFGAFVTIAAERSIDPGSGQNAGFLLCDTADTIAQQFVPPFAEGALAAVPGVPTAPIESDFGFHVIRLQTYAESILQLEPFYGSGFIQATMAIDDADIHVDSRYGTADGVNVVPLG